MPSEFDNDLLREAVIHLKAGELDAARRYLERALDLADDNTTRLYANYYLATVSTDPAQKRNYLEEALAFDPANAEVRKALAVLDGKLKPDEIVDANHLSAQSRDTQTVTADRFTCPKCGGRMVFAPDGRSLVCESCSRQHLLSADAPANQQDFILAMAGGQGQRTPIAMKTFRCKGCGASFLLPAQVISETCSYCGSVYVLAGSRELVEPDSIIPLGFDQHEAARRLVGWVEKHRIIPQGKVQAPRGLYLPVWTFDVTGEVPWGGQVRRNRQEIPVQGVRSTYLSDLVVYGSSKLANLLPHIVKDFSWSGAVAYDPRYLAGWPAEIYETSLAEASLDARKQAVDSVRAMIYSQQMDLHDLHYSTSGLSILSFKLVLVPIWVTEYVQEERTLRVIINGKSGGVYGETLSHGILGWLEDILDS